VIRFFRIVELEDARGWACRFGRTEHDVRPERAAAEEHMTELAAHSPSAEIMVHRLDGSVHNLDTV
jgi:hypothetical protein